jgi:hypothetical protein
VVLSLATETPAIMRHNHESATHESNSFLIRDFSYSAAAAAPFDQHPRRTGLTISTAFKLHWGRWFDHRRGRTREIYHEIERRNVTSVSYFCAEFVGEGSAFTAAGDT